MWRIYIGSEDGAEYLFKGDWAECVAWLAGQQAETNHVVAYFIFYKGGD